MSDNLSNNIDVTDPQDWSWDNQVVKTAGIILSKTLEYDTEDIFNACIVALTNANAHFLVKDLELTKKIYDDREAYD